MYVELFNRFASILFSSVSLSRMNYTCLFCLSCSVLHIICCSINGRISSESSCRIEVRNRSELETDTVAQFNNRYQDKVYNSLYYLHIVQGEPNIITKQS